MKPITNRVAWFVLFPLSWLIVGFSPVHGGWRHNPVTISVGQFNPEFSGAEFHRFLVATINVPADFREQMENITATRISRLAKDRWHGTYEDVAIGFRKVFPEISTFQPEKKYETQELLDKIAKEKIDVLVMINIFNEGGKNIEDVETLPAALQYSANYVHDISSVASYRFCKITLFDIKSGHQIWKGDGVVKAKPGTKNWYHESAVTLAKYLVAHLKKDGVIRER